MCGILGLASGHGSTPPLSEPLILEMRDAMAHRGPDGAGFWAIPTRQAILAHRRLAVIDPTPNASQPFLDSQGRGALVYNGELYNDAELRSELATLGWSFHTRSDTETILAAIIHWGAAALPKLRGMFALGFCDLIRNSLLIARDPLGVKPLYWFLEPATAAAPAQLAFASEIPPLLKHPLIPTRPDFVAINAYLSTIRTTLGRRTLFESVRALLPGEAIEFDLSRPDLAAKRSDFSPCVTPSNRFHSTADAAAELRTIIEDSVSRHLRADVPTCSLLSGGLDSSIIAMLVAQRDPNLNTYCSGAHPDQPSAAPTTDFDFAAALAAQLHTNHHEAPVSRDLFRQRWPEMIDATGLPLSTPNEVAINAVAKLLRSQGNIVALSGEGADELFGGYAIPLAAAHATIHSSAADPVVDIIEGASWIAPSVKPHILREHAWAADAHEHLLESYRADFRELSETSGPDPLEPHLRLQRRINLDGLLRRLDSATMLESVEGRTPFADSAVAAFAESLPMIHKFRFNPAGSHATKVALRQAFADRLPPGIVAREKASFPLPFQGWMADHVASLTTSSLAQELFSDAALLAVATKPNDAWRFAWPMINIAIWGKKWWP